MKLDTAKITDPGRALEAACTLIPQERGPNRFLSDAARNLLGGVMTSFVLSGKEWNLDDCGEAMRTKESMRQVLEKHEDTKHLVEIYFFPEECFRNIMATISASLERSIGRQPDTGGIGHA